MDLLLIRHARPLPVIDAARRPDPGLDTDGVCQAEAMAGALAAERIDALWCSPMRRARRTAEALGRSHGLHAVHDERLAEITIGEDRYVPVDTRGPVSDDARRFIDQWRAHLRTDEGRELVRVFRARVATVMSEIAATHPEGTVAVVCHGGVINAVLTDALGIEALLTFDPDFASITRARIGRSGRVRVISVNEHAHIRALETACGS